MATSYMHVIPIVCNQLELRQPRRVLDIGIGNGKYGLLAREYGHATTVDGVEAEPRYVGAIQEAIYDTIHFLDIGKGFKHVSRDYDLVLLIDCIEHIPKERAHQVLRHFNNSPILISTPAEDLPQHSEEFPFENHISKWEEHDFKDYEYARIEDPRRQALILTIRPNL